MSHDIREGAPGCQGIRALCATEGKQGTMHYRVQKEGRAFIEVEYNGRDIKESVVTQTGDGIDSFCYHCLLRITESLKKMEGVKK